MWAIVHSAGETAVMEMPQYVKYSVPAVCAMERFKLSRSMVLYSNADSVRHAMVDTVRSHGRLNDTLVYW
jgi:hypothetical protein